MLDVFKQQMRTSGLFCSIHVRCQEKLLNVIFSPAHRNYGHLRKTSISGIAIFKIILIFKVNLIMEVGVGRVQTLFLKA